jgi:hypothetical protein
VAEFDHEAWVQTCAVSLTKRQQEILQQMADHPNDEEGEIVHEGREAWIGETKIAPRTVLALVRMMAVRQLSWGDQGPQYYVINQTGLMILAEAEK